MEQIRCLVERVTYTNEQTGFTVLKARVKGHSDLVAVVGGMAAVNVGSVLLVSGEWKTDAKYGRQFAAVSWQEKLPATVAGIERYLGSGLIKGIGPKFARRIVEKFGPATLDVIEQTPDKLISVDGIGGRRVAAVKKAWADQKEIKNVMLFLQEHRVSSAHAVKIFKTYGAGSIQTVKENPYRLADDIWGIGFKTADAIAMKMGFAQDGYPRCRSGLLFALSEASNDGHCFLPRAELLQAAAALLQTDETRLDQALAAMLTAGDAYCEPPDKIYLLPLYHSERGVAQRLRKILTAAASPAVLPAEPAGRQDGRTPPRRETDVAYDAIQREAIRLALAAKVMILTGGPGVGKTTTTKGIISALTAAGCEILLCAPTGRAAKRLAEATGREAKTIHRMLGFSPQTGWEKNAANPLAGDALIVDECSMIDVVLMYNLLKAVPDNMSVVFAGDADQLPSVGAGNVLLDMIASGAIPVVRLQTVYRQAQTSDIVMNAHRVNRGEFPLLKQGKDTDFFFIEENDPEKLPALIADLCHRRLPGYFQVDPVAGIQVLTPMQRGLTGAANLNALLQEKLNPGRVCLRRGGAEYRPGDKVMQIRNNYDKNVFNGDIGVIEKVDLEERELTALFDGQPVVYDVSELDELVLAYATTIHKAQGSEYPIVVMPFTTQHFVMLQRNLLYTGITRAKRALTLVGTKKAIACAVRNNTVAKRNTYLAERLRLETPAATKQRDP
ncbi:MAG: ATP-dependent RecD-like DNA helicase [Gracilibacteraceae bacterium]|jgi:exodeoxyribonuclease V alpha subunit|nr:ATP-dependent RecD-like DNA helicase [Gracilibacteraceae bacterium]